MEAVRGSFDREGRRVAIQPADVRGRFTRARWLVFAVLIAIYVALPWIPIGGHPAVFLDIDARRFYLFGATFNAQDTWMMVIIVGGVGLTLITLTALLGRVWCGYACPQTVFLEALYRRVERWLLGARAQRIRLAAGPWRWRRIWRTATMHLAFAAISLALAHVFLAYFVSLAKLYAMMQGSPGEHPAAFALVTTTAAVLYVNFAWFREQLCVVVCPYGRLQSVLIDADSLIVGYDARRGEPRGKATRAGTGDCVDCKRCVVVCPTGIDIRDGLQMDCIACAACIDACDEVMDRLRRPRGLVRYDSQTGLRGEPRRIARPRVVAYAAVLAAGALVAALALGRRHDYEANLLRAVGAPFVLEDDEVRNSFDLHLVNKKNASARFALAARSEPGVTVTLPMADLELQSLADAHVPVVVSVDREHYRPGMEARIGLTIDGAPAPREVVARLLGPTPAHEHRREHDEERHDQEHR